MKKLFKYEFEENKRNSLSYEMSMDEDEHLESFIENGIPFLYMNRSAMLTMAKLLIRFADGSYGAVPYTREKNFGEGPDVLTILLGSRS
jgi:hypothetical protein